MKRKIALSVALAVSVVSLFLISYESTEGSHHRGFAADTGVVTLGPNQMLRITAVNRGKAESNVRFTKMEYSEGTCDGGVCAHQVASDTTSAPMTITGEAGASVNILATTYGGNVRGIVFSNIQDVRVNACIIDALTGAIVDCYVVQSGPNA